MASLDILTLDGDGNDDEDDENRIVIQPDGLLPMDDGMFTAFHELTTGEAE